MHPHALNSKAFGILRNCGPILLALIVSIVSWSASAAGPRRDEPELAKVAPTVTEKAAPPAPPAATAASLVSADSLMATVRELTSARYAGRLAGGQGYAEAARWAAARMAALGLRPGGDDGYLQRFEIEHNEIRASRLAVSLAGGPWRELELGRDYVCRGFSGSGKVEASVVFLGYGISAPELGHDDYAGIDVEGKVVLALKPAPSWQPEGQAEGAEGWGQANLPRPKARAAADHGAVALLLVDPPAADEPARGPIGSVLHGPGEQDESFPQIEIGVPLADELLAAAGAGTLAEVRAAIDADRKPHPLPLEARVDLMVEAAYDAAAPTANVVGILPGTDPALAQECLIVGGHLDHVGLQGATGGGSVLFPGANDNASGSAAVLEIARAMTASARAPRLSVVFVLFSGEEQGLNGARWHAEHPVFPLERTRAMLNLDCVAAGDSIQAGGGQSSPVLWALAREAAAAGPGPMVERSWRGGGADAAPFFDEGVRTLYFHTPGGYGQLHRPGDTAESLKPAVFAELVRIACATAAAVAMGEYQAGTEPAPPEPSGHD